MTKRKFITAKEKKGKQILADCNEKCDSLFEAIAAMATALAQKHPDASFDESMKLAKMVVSLAHRIVETDREHEKSLNVAKKFLLANPELCTDD